MPSVAIFPSNPTNFSQSSIPDQTGKTFIVTGGNTGIGYQTCLQLALKGATVILAARNPQRAQDAINRIKKECPTAKISHLELDLKDLKAVKKSAETFKDNYKTLDGLINNAGIMAGPFRLTKDGVEEQFGTNHLGHFLFTRELLPVLLNTPHARVVNVSSVAHGNAPSQGIDFENINQESAMSNWTRYGQSKLANILFSLALDKRYGDKLFVNSLHPGWVKTELIRGVQESSPFLARVSDFFTSFLALDPLRGAFTSLYVATSPDIVSKNIKAKYFIPLADSEDPIPLAKDQTLADRLWDFSEKLVAEKLK